MTVSNDDALVRSLTESQRLGFLGARPIGEVIDHARGFVVALESLPTGSRVLDLGSGGGVPGLVIAHDRPDLFLVLVDRRTKRTDFLLRVVHRLDWSGRVQVIAADVSEVAAVEGGAFDAVVARGFGPPASTLTTAVQLVRPGGWIVISEPPSGDRWAPEMLDTLGVVRLPVAGSLAIFHRY